LPGSFAGETHGSPTGPLLHRSGHVASALQRLLRIAARAAVPADSAIPRVDLRTILTADCQRSN